MLTCVSNINRHLPRLKVTLLVLAVVGALTKFLELPPSFGVIAFGLQWGFFLLHGWPQRYLARLRPRLKAFACEARHVVYPSCARAQVLRFSTMHQAVRIDLSLRPDPSPSVRFADSSIDYHGSSAVRSVSKSSSNHTQHLRGGVVHAAGNLSVQPYLTGLEGGLHCTWYGLNDLSASPKQDSRFSELKKEFWSFSIAWNLQVLWVFLLQLPAA